MHEPTWIVCVFQRTCLGVVHESAAWASATDRPDGRAGSIARARARRDSPPAIPLITKRVVQVLRLCRRSSEVEELGGVVMSARHLVRNKFPAAFACSQMVVVVAPLMLSARQRLRLRRQRAPP